LNSFHAQCIRSAAGRNQRDCGIDVHD
jgi:hypothetical protein